MRRLLVLLLLAGVAPAAAQVTMDGSFVAAKACPALASIKRNENPGNVEVEPGAHYVLRGKNKDEASHYWIEVPGAVPLERWVAAGCGTTGGKSATAPAAKPAAKKAPAGPQPLYVLALSWQPAFCEGKPGKRECRASTHDRGLSLHGLWPQPGTNVYCQVSNTDEAADKQGRWRDLPEPELSLSTRNRLEAIMPGTQSLLERHEWIKHGTCFPGAGAEAYFEGAARLTEAINGSAVGELLVSNIGRVVKVQDIRAAFDRAFGPGAGQRVRVACERDGNRQLIVELTIGLRGDIAGGASVAELMLASNPTNSGCPAGIVDTAGQQ